MFDYCSGVVSETILQVYNATLRVQSAYIQYNYLSFIVLCFVFNSALKLDFDEKFNEI